MSIKLDKLKLIPAYQVVSGELERLITSGVLRPGDPMPSEFELAGNFGVNRSTVREGIRQLETEGLVRREGRKRLVVARPFNADLTPRTTRALIMHEVTFRELWTVAHVLEPLAAALAAQQASEPEIAALRANLRNTEAAVACGESPAELDTAFHAMIAAAARNRALLLSREPTGVLLYPAFEAILPHLPQAPARLLEAHQRQVDAIAACDSGQAELWARKHILDFRRGWELVGIDLDMPVSAHASAAAAIKRRPPAVASLSEALHRQAGMEAGDGRVRG